MHCKMIRRKIPSTATVSHRKSLDNKHTYPAIRKKQSDTIIHVTIGLPKEFGSPNNNVQSSNLKPKKDIALTKTSLLQTSFSTKTTHLSTSSKVTPHENVRTGNNQQNKTDLTDRTGITNDHHQKAKQKQTNRCSRGCFIKCLFAILLILLIVTAILLALLLKPKPQTIIPSSEPLLRWNTTGITVAGINSTLGNTSNQLQTPVDVVLDHANNIYIADRQNHRIQKYFFDSSVIETVAGNGSAGTSLSQLNNPSKITLDSNENLYISDFGNHRILFWPNGASSGTKVAGTGFSGNAMNELYLPYGIALNPTSGTLYIADYYNHRLMSYTKGATNGTLLLGVTGQGLTNSQLSYPLDVYVDSLSNSLVIVNFGAHKIVRYVLGASNWTLVAGSTNGSSSVQLKYPTGVTFDPIGNMYVADRENNRIQFFSYGQSNGTTIAGITGTSGSDAYKFNRPWSVTLDNQLNLYVADANNHRIQKFLRY